MPLKWALVVFLLSSLIACAVREPKESVCFNQVVKSADEAERIVIEDLNLSDEMLARTQIRTASWKCGWVVVIDLQNAPPDSGVVAVISCDGRLSYD